MGRLLPVLLYGTGLLFWLRFFWFAELFAYDWSLSLAYQEILKQAIVEWRVPYVSTFHHYSDRYLGTPETPLSPQFLLAPWLSPWAFNVFNVCFLYSLSYVGLLLIRRRYRLGGLPFTLLFLLFGFNGYIVARVGVGHTMWFGYWLLPFFYLCLFDVLERTQVRRGVFGLALVLFLMELQGSFHLVLWCGMLLGLIAIFRPMKALPIIAAGVLTVLLCLFRVAPSAVSLHGTPLQYLAAYPTVGTLLDGLTAARKVNWLEPTTGCGWWEMNAYVGFVGLGLLVWFGWVHPWRSGSEKLGAHWPLYGGILGMVVLCLGPVYQPLFESGMPLLNSQRVPARFMVVPLTACVVLAAIGLQQFLAAETRGRVVVVMIAVALVWVASGLWDHADPWTVRNIEVSSDPVARVEAVAIAPVAPDMSKAGMRGYVITLWASVVVSGVALVGVLAGFVRALLRARTSAGLVTSRSD